jgi:protein phosphatase 1L
MPLPAPAEGGFFGVFDGHGAKGRLIAEFAARDIVDQLRRMEPALHARSSEGVCEALVRAFSATDAACLEHMLPTGESGGTTATAVYIRASERRAWVANAGDSRCVLSRAGEAVALTCDHKPDRVDERSRIEGAGGRVVFAGTWRVEGVLSVSRSIGDQRFKKLVPALPDVHEEALDPAHDELLILATDGLWNVMSNQQAVDIARCCRSSDEASEALSTAAIERGSGDNVCVVVVDLRSYLAAPGLDMPESPTLPLPASAAQPMMIDEEGRDLDREAVSDASA